MTLWRNDGRRSRRPLLGASGPTAAVPPSLPQKGPAGPTPAAAANPAKGQAAPPPLGHLPHGLPAVLSLDGAANPAISISKITCYSPFTGYLACNFGIWDSFFRIYLHFYQKGQCLVKMKVFFYKNVSQFRKSLETVPLQIISMRLSNFIFIFYKYTFNLTKYWPFLENLLKQSLIIDTIVQRRAAGV